MFPQLDAWVRVGFGILRFEGLRKFFTHYIIPQNKCGKKGIGTCEN
jgi:hypothetical protein